MGCDVDIYSHDPRIIMFIGWPGLPASNEDVPLSRKSEEEAHHFSQVLGSNNLGEHGIYCAQLGCAPQNNAF